ncbi:uncharacterized protein LOC100275397 [Zea mays]|uniref:Uncharacterized protein n=1 Tax=Zea mays TaxID=4577 RepID=A0A1D6H8X8_MAIZE|nr:uncharacterized protein LOC100275397 [Zea mays]AQK71173.1 hypothetical protein ZEAMMB73_Zm00001d016570 [Zea mays]
MDLADGRDDALNGGVGVGVGVEETRRRRKVELVQEAIRGFLEEKRSDGQGGGEERLTARLREEEQELLLSLLSKLGELKTDPDPDILEEPSSSRPDHGHQPAGGGERSKEVEPADIAKDLSKIKRQNTITHLLLGAVIVLTAVWQVNEVSFLLWLQSKLSNPFKSLGDMVKASLLKLRGRRPVLESSPLPLAGVPDVSRADLPTFVIGGTEHVGK